MFTKATTFNDFNLIESLAREIWTEHYTPIIGKPQVNYMLMKYSSAKYMSEQTKDPNCHYYIIKDSKDPIGYISITFKNNDLFLNKFYVISSERGRGFGRMAINFIESLARGKGLEKITLRVNKLNKDTIDKYEKLGFLKVESLVQDIGNGYVMDDYKMEKLL